MKRCLPINIILLFFVTFIFFESCKNGNSINSDNNSEDFSRISLELDWYALADNQGKLDNEMGKAAAEVAEFSNDGKLIASGSKLGYNVKVWDLKGNLVFDYKCDSSLKVVSFFPDDKYLLAGGKFNQLFIWEVDEWKKYKTIEFPAGIESLRFSHDGEILAIGRYDGIINFMKTSDLTFVDSVQHRTGDVVNDPDFRADVNSLDFSPDDKYLLAGGFDGRLKIWYLPEMKLIKNIQAHDNSIKSVRINKKGDCIATASSGEDYKGDNTIKLWDFKSCQLLHKLSFPMGMETVDFSPMGNYLIGGGRESRYDDGNKEPKGHIYFYSIPNDILTEPIRQIHNEQVFNLEYLSFNTEGTKLLSSHQDGTVRLWDIIFN